VGTTDYALAGESDTLRPLTGEGHRGVAHYRGWTRAVDDQPAHDVMQFKKTVSTEIDVVGWSASPAPIRGVVDGLSFDLTSSRSAANRRLHITCRRAGIQVDTPYKIFAYEEPGFEKWDWAARTKFPEHRAGPTGCAHEDLSEVLVMEGYYDWPRLRRRELHIDI